MWIISSEREKKVKKGTIIGVILTIIWYSTIMSVVLIPGDFKWGRKNDIIIFIVYVLIGVIITYGVGHIIREALYLNEASKEREELVKNNFDKNEILEIVPKEDKYVENRYIFLKERAKFYLRSNPKYDDYASVVIIFNNEKEEIVIESIRKDVLLLYYDIVTD